MDRDCGIDGGDYFSRYSILCKELLIIGVNSFIWVQFASIFIIFIILILYLLYNPYFSILQYRSVPYSIKIVISICPRIIRIRKILLSYGSNNTDTHYCDLCHKLKLIQPGSPLPNGPLRPSNDRCVIFTILYWLGLTTDGSVKQRLCICTVQCQAILPDQYHSRADKRSKKPSLS
jgi:hypothetical protein